MAIRGAGLSFKLASAAYLLTEIATSMNDLAVSASQDELDASVFNPGAQQPTKDILYGATTRTVTLSGRWSPAMETFMTALSGASNVAYQHCPEGAVLGKTMIYGTCNVGAWAGPGQAVNGVIGWTLPLALVTRAVKTVITPPTTVALTSNTAADPTVITAAAHGLATGDVVTIAGNTASVPPINGTHGVTVLSPTTFTIPVNVTTPGTGGTIQKY